jgi:hypothetical protein
MDPDANLAEQLAIVTEVNAIRDQATDLPIPVNVLHELADHAFRLAELVESLDEWIRKGGGLPREWVKGIKRTAR